MGALCSSPPAARERTRHELAIFERRRVLRYMAAAGMQARFLKRGLQRDRGLYVDVKEQVSS